MKKKEETPRFNFTVMIVDDEKHTLEELSEILKNNYNIIEANDGDEALAKLKSLENPEDLCVIISDQRMPNMTGLQLFKHLHSKVIDIDHKKTQEYKITPETQFILLTGYDDKDVLKEALNDTYLFQFIDKDYRIDLGQKILKTVQGAVEAHICKKDLNLCKAELLKKFTEIESLKKKVDKLSKENQELRDRLAALERGKED